MATKKGTGFKAPNIGKALPKGSRIKRNSDGTVSVAKPRKK